MPQEKDQEQLSKLLALIQEALQQDEALREKYQIGEKFRFIRDRLQNLLVEVQKEPEVKEKVQKTAEGVTVEEDEVLVYVHLYNAQGQNFRSWQTIIHPKAFFDFSVNRPIYKEKKDVEAFILGKPKRTQHGYLTIAVKKDRLLAFPGGEGLKDAMGNPLAKVKEGSFRREKVLSFSHDEHEYGINEDGDLVKKS